MSLLKGLKQGREESQIKAITELRLQGNQTPQARVNQNTKDGEGLTGWLLGPERSHQARGISLLRPITNYYKLGGLRQF